MMVFNKNKKWIKKPNYIKGRGGGQRPVYFTLEKDS